MGVDIEFVDNNELTNHEVMLTLGGDNDLHLRKLSHQLASLWSSSLGPRIF